MARTGRAGVDIRIVEGFPDCINALSEGSAGAPSFLRASWYEAAAPGQGWTIIASSGDKVLAAVPLAKAGPRLLPVSAVPGSYWPFRSILIDDDAGERELASIFAHPRLREAARPVWRLGPVYRCDPAIPCLKRAASQGGWTVLTRVLGRSFRLDLAGEQGAWPSKASAKRLRLYQRRLEALGDVTCRIVAGRDWNGEVIAALAAVEARSWVGTQTDRSGAKFLGDDAPAMWRRLTEDPVISANLSAALLECGGRPVAFSFDLRDGPIQYALASSFDAEFAPYRVGRIVTHRQWQWAASQGVRTVDLGCGDSGYKSELGARPGPEIVDLLLVQSRPLARLLELGWGAESRISREVFAQADPPPADGLRPYLQPAAWAATAAAAAMIAAGSE